MLTTDRVEFILNRLPALTIGVVGDLFLDRYLDIDAALTEESVETGLDAYQVTRVRSVPGAAGTVINNLAALGVQRVIAVSVIGDDGEGYELRRALGRLKIVDATRVYAAPDRRTPTYTKPMLQEAGQPPRELNRLDIKNRAPLAEPLQNLVMESLAAIFPEVDALLVMDQVSDENCGVVTEKVRELLAQLGEANPEKFILADSRERIGLYRGVSIKPNKEECATTLFGKQGAISENGVGMAITRRRPSAWVDMKGNSTLAALAATDNPSAQGWLAAVELAQRVGRPVFCTNGEKGMFLAKPQAAAEYPVILPAYPVAGPIDIVGAGDSTSAAIGGAVAAGATHEEAAAFGNLVASITIQQLGTTGTATPEQVRKRWREVRTG